MRPKALENQPVVERGIVPVEFAPVTTNYQTEEAPSEGFFDEDLVVRQLTLEELDSRDFPVDEIGMPMPIYIPNSYRVAGYRKNKHHHWGPENELKNKHGELEKMLRYSTVQTVPVNLHNRFNLFFEKTPLANTRIGRLGHLMLAGAKYVGDKAVDVRPAIPEIRQLTLAERQAIWSNREIHLQNTRKVQDLLIDHVVKQNIPDINNDEIVEFLRTKDDERRNELGKKLFRIAAKVAVEPVELSYLRAWDSGFLPRQDLRKHSMQPGGLVEVRAMPRDPHLFVARHVVPNKYVLRNVINDLRNRLEDRLVAA